uniref:Uncharacterized protein n=1 Tax=Octactis speculum TaxID=3111310 RepID=A0A7S2D3X2_9STRA
MDLLRAAEAQNPDLLKPVEDFFLKRRQESERAVIEEEEEPPQKKAKQTRSPPPSAPAAKKTVAKKPQSSAKDKAKNTEIEGDEIEGAPEGALDRVGKVFTDTEDKTDYQITMLRKEKKSSGKGIVWVYDYIAVGKGSKKSLETHFSEVEDLLSWARIHDEK